MKQGLFVVLQGIETADQGKPSPDQGNPAAHRRHPVAGASGQLRVGGPDLRTLFCCAQTSVYTLRVKVPGNPHPWYKRRGQ